MPIRHSNDALSARKIKRVCEVMSKQHINSAIKKIIAQVGEGWDNPDNLLLYRKLLRDEVNAALFDRDDRVMHLLQTGEITTKGHEANIVVLASLINLLLDARMKEHVSRIL